MSNPMRTGLIAAFVAGSIVGVAVLVFLTGGRSEPGSIGATAQSKSDGGSSAKSESATLPPDVKVGGEYEVFGNGARIAGRHKIVELRGVWARCEVHDGNEKWEQWLNFNQIVFFRKL